ncbi:unnamed protein product [Pseudo-nitzschia multistriata]|uniref:Suppressor of forked domain-containing protein n=1 Tax=Pseudo-nitzschia multistriata TaxID=183589 RepID=A0A448Z3S5_9STRA|nr:unnamed protein product [Pseudo-nitzschia multistriata]
MATDPRRRNLVKTEPVASETAPGIDATLMNANHNASGNPIPPKNEFILFSGVDDAMDEDEDLFDDSEPLQDEPQQQAVPSSSGAAPTVGVAAGGGSASYYSSGVEANYQYGYGNQGSSVVVPHRDVDLLSTVISPSPFAHHSVGGAGSSRYRNALTRIAADPRSDVEAWGALLAEASACWKSLHNSSADNGDGGIGGTGSNSARSMQVVHVNIAARTSAETQLQLDWIESCYGAFLKYFPYSCGHIRSVGDILFVQSARVGEEGGPTTDYGQEAPGTMSRSQQAQWKLETILRKALGVDLEGNNAAVAPLPRSGEKDTTDGATTTTKQHSPAAIVGGTCTPSVDLWLLYIKTRIRHTRRKHGNSKTMEAGKAIMEDSRKAYELALGFSGFTCHDNHLLWKAYLDFCKASVPPIVSEREQNAASLIMTPQQHMMWLREVYQKLICHPMTGLDQLWQEYESFEKNQSEALAAALVQEWQPKYQHARNIYLERNKVFNPQALHWKTRLAVPPVSTSWVDQMDADHGTPGIGATGAGGKKSSDSKKKLDDKDASGGATTEEELREHNEKLQEEFDYLTLWKKRVAYERTNPERLTNTQELAHRVRQAYKEMVCVLTLYPEVWHMWSTWEETVVTSSAAASDDTSAANPAAVFGNRSIAVLELGQEHIPDSTLLVHAQAQLEEIHFLSKASSAAGTTKTASPGDNPALRVFEKYIERAPTSLGFCLYQRLVRRYRGKDAARQTFARARRILSHGYDAGNSGLSFNAGEKLDRAGAEPAASEDSTATKVNGKRWMVTNRLDPSIGSKSVSRAKSQVASNDQEDTSSSIQVAPGPITWHLYACHATIEHRLNKSPEIAGRVYELGLRKHSSFLTKPSYVLKYAKLLLELQDTVNLRALLTRALAACADSKKSGQVEALWDMTLECEELWSILEPENIEVAVAIERKRRAALLGPDIEDVSTGSRVGLSDNRTTIGVQKSTLAEQLLRTDGYDTSSLIVNGLGRTVNVLDIMGLWGDGASRKQHSGMLNNTDDGADELIPGGKSDRSYQNRLQFAHKVAAGVSLIPGTMGGSEAPGSKLLSARERLSQQQGGAGPGFQNTPIQLAIQQQPEWLRGMLLMLPASRLRSPIVPKAPPHLVVQALTSLRQNKLPEERPNDDNEGKNSSSSQSGKKRSALDANGGDSSDEDTGPTGTGGYGTQFRARQRARMRMNGIEAGSS